MKWAEFQSAFQRYGFTVVDEYRFSVPDTGKNPMHLVAAHREEKLLLVADSHILVNEAVNRAKVYGALSFQDADMMVDQLQYFALTAHSVIDQGSPFLFDRDVTDGDFSRLDVLRSTSAFVSWNHPRGYQMHPFLADYASYDDSPTSIDAANSRALDRLVSIAPPWVLDFTGLR